MYYFKYKYWNLKNFNFLKNCFAGPNRTWYPLPDVIFALASSFWQIAFVKWKLLPFVQIVSRIIIVLCDNSWGPFEFITSTIAWKRMQFKIFMWFLSCNSIINKCCDEKNWILTWNFQNDCHLTFIRVYEKKFLILVSYFDIIHKRIVFNSII